MIGASKMLIKETMRRTTVKKRVKRKIWKMRNGNMNEKGTLNGRFDCTEKGSLLSTGGLHASHLLCWDK